MKELTGHLLLDDAEDVATLLERLAEYRRSPDGRQFPDLAMRAEQSERERMLRTRVLSPEVRRQARQIAGSWSVEFLAHQYFEWIAEEDIMPNNPGAHFLNFIQAHRRRNGEIP